MKVVGAKVYGVCVTGQVALWRMHWRSRDEGRLCGNARQHDGDAVVICVVVSDA